MTEGIQTFLPPQPAPPQGPPPTLGSGVPEERHPTRRELVELLGAMMTARRLEERSVELYRQNVITGGCYTGVGNEATSVATAYALGPDDVIVPTHRDMGSHVVRGTTPLTIMRQYMKRATAETKGRDSSLHLGREGTNVVGTISHLGHMMSVATGIALAERIKKRDVFVLTSVGEGATSLGDFHEALNFAAVARAPVLFVIVNNQYAYSTPSTIQYACARLSDRALGYGIEGGTVDGTDVVAIYDAARNAVARGRRGAGPTLLEAITMRMRGHSEHDDARYVPKSLLEAWRSWDPIERATAYAKQRGVDEAQLEQLRSTLNREIDEAISTAISEPLPSPEWAREAVYRRWDPEWTVPDGAARHGGQR
ncbi:MAG: thiamine pyrophosphate-dependent dehydrogenase E1 component subunit alpha [Deltaproteobacteria bacterium]|nr:thiamine pyrophosphate-dependent dehydrogenase E1 component subunit alpha [Deltaproteobacteria bacterium]